MTIDELISDFRDQHPLLFIVGIGCHLLELLGVGDASIPLMASDQVASDLACAIPKSKVTPIRYPLCHTTRRVDGVASGKIAPIQIRLLGYLRLHRSNDGGPPNNWLSEFGGSAWQYDATTAQYYYHAFLTPTPSALVS